MTNYCGYIAFMGRPNAGKSTLVNALVGQKVAGVSRKPQTTRNKILGIATSGKHQLLFLDTPGMHRSKGYARINALMNKEAFSVIADADAIAYTVDLTEGWDDEDTEFFKQIQGAASEELQRVYLTKADCLKKKDMMVACREITATIRNLGFEGKVQPVSAKRADSITEVYEDLKCLLPEGPFQFDEDDVTDRSTRFLISELIRESLFRQFGQELPYDMAVVVESFKTTPDLVSIQADIYVARESQKGMVVGKRGAKIREIGIESRQKIQDLLGSKVFLETHVRVRDGWNQDKSSIAELTDITF